MLTAWSRHSFEGGFSGEKYLKADHPRAPADSLSRRTGVDIHSKATPAAAVTMKYRVLSMPAANMRGQSRRMALVNRSSAYRIYPETKKTKVKAKSAQWCSAGKKGRRINWTSTSGMRNRKRPPRLSHPPQARRRSAVRRPA
jgi:hypothetical protein